MPTWSTCPQTTLSLQIRKNFGIIPSSKSITKSYNIYFISFSLSRPYSLSYFQNLFSIYLTYFQVSLYVTLTQYHITLVTLRLQRLRVSLTLTYPIIQSIFRLYSYNQSIPSTTSSFPNSRISKVISIYLPLIVIRIGSILIYIIPSLQVISVTRPYRSTTVDL